MSDRHDWLERDFAIDGRRFELRHCRRCYRDMAKGPDLPDWTPVHILAFGFELLDAEATIRWVAAGCTPPMLPLSSSAKPSGNNSAAH